MVHYFFYLTLLMNLHYLGKHEVPKLRVFTHAVLMVCQTSRCMTFVEYY